MKKFKIIFPGSLEELKKIIKESRVRGYWRSEKLYTGGTKYVFKSEYNGVLTWWISTKAISFQGKPQGQQELLDIMGEYLRKEYPSEERSVQDADEYEE